jgi:hypothetical protein
MIEKKWKGLFEIGLLILSIFAFAYIISETQVDSFYFNKKNKLSLKDLLKFAVSLIFSEKSLVSALESSDLEQGVYTCLRAKDGSICQEYPFSECSSNCDGACFPSTRNNVPGCKLGTCYDSSEGTCQERSPESICSETGGQWFDNTGGNIQECQKRCCVLGDRVKPLITQRECLKIGERLGIEPVFRSEIIDELSCLALATTQSEGACVFNSNGENNCKFITGFECLENGGEFYEDYLCSHPSLKSGCEKQATAKCVEGKDEIYWFDSCGNRENIYHVKKIESWNEGKVLRKIESCSLDKSKDNLGNQKTCGNCNRLLGSSCGEKTSSERLSDSSLDFVCRDSRCRDSNGEVRENGESWCEYQGAVGVVEGSTPKKRGKENTKNSGFLRAVDTPGSRHFRASCIDSEVQVDPCQDYRNEICTEQQYETERGKDISSAACVKNLWQLCIEYNTELQDAEGREEVEEAIEKRNEECLKNPTCMLKSVNVDRGFAFDICVPKYSPGFDLQSNPEGGEIACSMGNQECTAIFVKEIGGWNCVHNCDCLEKEFGEQMNDLCMSLGDCGASVNYLGELSESYDIDGKTKHKELNDDYLREISKYSDVVRGDFIELNSTEYLEVVGGAEKLGESGGSGGPELNEDTLGALGTGGMVSGAVGSIAMLAIQLGLISSIQSFFYSAAVITSVLSPNLTAFLVSIGSNAPYLSYFASLAIGFTIMTMIFQFTGIGAGLDPAITWSLIGIGTASSAILITAAISAGLGGTAIGDAATSFLVVAACGPPCWFIAGLIFLLVILTIVILDAIGIGDIKEVPIEFTCEVWQPPLGGEKCGECGRDGYSCSKYACQSIGATCRLINEGSVDEKCVDISPDDVSPPRISVWNDVLGEGYEYEEERGGVKIVSREGDGCIGGDSTITFGIELNEPGKCVYDFESKSGFEEMESNFGGRTVFVEQHAQQFIGFELRNLGELDLPEYEPEARVDLTYHIRCRDASGNENINEYLINMCVKPGEDLQNPVITLREPAREEVAIDAKDVNARVYVNEPADCRWSLEDEGYDSMKNNMSCLISLGDRHPLFGWRCSGKFDFGLELDEKSYYIDCLDQPWKNETERDERHSLSNSYEYKVKRSENELKIDYVVPNGTLEFGVVPASVVLEVGTSGGVDNGRATCSLFGANMLETFESVHSQTFNQILTGKYEFPIECVDRVGNSVEAVAEFTALLDVKAPIVTRVYDLGRQLNVVTNEKSECSYKKAIGKSDRKNCNFAFENGTLMSGVEYSHTGNFDGTTHYIKCKDKWENIPGGCSVIVRGS